MTATTTLPALLGYVHKHGYDGRYRLWTRSHGVDFDQLPSYDQGGPATVPLDGWNVSTSTTTRVSYDGGGSSAEGDGVHTLSVWRGDPGRPARHPLHGTTYPSLRDADRAAYQAGVLGFFVKEPDAFRYGLPTAIERGMPLEPLIGVRIRVERDVPGYGRSTHIVVPESLWHSKRCDVGGMVREEPHDTCPGGNTAFTLPYDTTIITRL